MKELNNNTIDAVLEQPACWTESGPYNDIVLSTSVNLSRNIHNVSFPERQDSGEAEYIHSLAVQFARESAYNSGSIFVNINELTFNNKRLLKELDIIKDDLAGKSRRSVITGPDGNYIINVNEEDHFNISVRRPGLQIDEACRVAAEVDRELNRYAVYAYSDSLGYITASPYVLGTGLRVSTILHLPVLSISKKIYSVFEIAAKNGIVLSGLDGGEKRVTGSIYRLTNKNSIGVNEADIIKLMQEATQKIIGIECSERDIYQLDHENQLEDKIFRSYGTLKYARSLDYSEAADCLSDLRLGIIISIISSPDLLTANRLMINCRQSHLEKIAGRIFMDDTECNTFRASYLRDELERSSTHG
ncbi:MAG: hypothetical protein MUC95_08445 [Spirochaetes bacterium]|nr:hypothetical protein [Spirochaetota bacterium]